MGTFIWLIFTTILGAWVGHHFITEAILGGVIGFLIGLILRFAFSDGLEMIGDGISGFGD